MDLREFLKELHRRNVWKVAVAYTAAAVVLLEVLTQLFLNFEAPHWVLKVITTLLIVGLPVACLMAWGFEFREGGVRSVPREPKATTDTKQVLPAPETSTPPSIAVLPFADMSAEHDQQYLGDGIAEELLNALAAIEGLNVAARTSSFSFAGKGASMEEIGRTLHVAHVLEGSVRRSGQKLRVTAQLIDVQSGFHRFTQSYDREVQDIFAIQNDIAREIATALLPKLGLGKEVMLVKHGTTNLDAYNLWLKAHQWLVNLDPMTVDQPIRFLRQAIALDPGYADAWGDLAYLQGSVAIFSADWLPLRMEAYRSATVALEHAPDNVPALIEMAIVSVVIHRDPAAAAGYLARARQRGVDLSVWGWSKAILHDGPLGRYDEALATIEEALAKDPLAPNLLVARALVLVGAGRVDEAVAAAEAALPLAAHAPIVLLAAVRANREAGKIARARELLEAANGTSVERFPTYMSEKIAAESEAGNRAMAQSLLDRLLEQGINARPSGCLAIGFAYAGLADFDRAIEWWSQSVERREPWSLYVVPLLYRRHPVVGKDPRFLALLKRMGLETDT